MISLNTAQRVVIVGGGTAGWFAALEMRHCMPAHVDILLVESEQIGIIGAGEGSIPNFEQALQRYGIDRAQFMQATQSTFKLGVCFDGWRADASSRYYHFFSTARAHISLTDWYIQGFYPMSSQLMAQRYPLDAFPTAMQMVDAQASQEQVAAHLHSNPKEVFAYHFDARKLATYLREIAQARGVRRVDAIVEHAGCDSTGKITQLHTDKGIFEGDFFIDASGFRQILAKKTLGIGWESFEKYLILDRALPFMMPLASEHPPLTTLSTAMQNGWMWTIPTQGRLGCGYVYSSAHTSEADALRELAQHFGHDVEPVNRLKFAPGRLEHCLQSNMMAVGLASGFVEPLEATSIAQTLYQLAFFGNLMKDNQRILSDSVVSKFNHDVVSCWNGILDFLVLHYDTDRSDTAFWRDIQHTPRTDSYLDFKDILKHRTPSHSDLVPYQMGGIGIFGVPSWEMVASAMGHIQPETCAAQLAKQDSLSAATLQAFSQSLSA